MKAVGAELNPSGSSGLAHQVDSTKEGREMHGVRKITGGDCDVFYAGSISHP